MLDFVKYLWVLIKGNPTMFISGLTLIASLISIAITRNTAVTVAKMNRDFSKELKEYEGRLGKELKEHEYKLTHFKEITSRRIRLYDEITTTIFKHQEHVVGEDGITFPRLSSYDACTLFLGDITDLMRKTMVLTDASAECLGKLYAAAVNLHTHAVDGIELNPADFCEFAKTQLDDVTVKSWMLMMRMESDLIMLHDLQTYQDELSERLKRMSEKPLSDDCDPPSADG